MNERASTPPSETEEKNKIDCPMPRIGYELSVGSNLLLYQPHSPRPKSERSSNPQMPPKSSRETRAPRHARVDSARSNKADRDSADLMLNDFYDEAQELSARLLSGMPTMEPNPEVWALCIKDLEAKRDQMVMHGAFNESIRIQEIINNAGSMKLEAIRRIAQLNEITDIQLRQSHSETDSLIFKHISKAKQIELKERLAEQLSQMEERHRRELVEHEEEWHSESKQRQFSHASTQLLGLRAQQNRLMNDQKFSEAKVVATDADKLEEEEVTKSFDAFNKAYINSRLNLLRKQEEEVGISCSTIVSKLEDFKRQRDIERLPFEHRKRTLENRENAANSKERAFKQRKRKEKEQMKGKKLIIVSDKECMVSEKPSLKLPPLPNIGDITCKRRAKLLR